MDTDNSSEDALWDAARQLAEPSERAAFLDAACAGNPALKERLENLLKAAPDADDFFERNALNLNHLPTLSVGQATVNTPPSEQPGNRIGHYELIQRIGEGGFGTVWMAEQVEPVKRRVALKIIKLGMDTQEVIARFEAERQALAMMDHPNIAKVLEAGATDKGRPFFVMELVKGVTITRHCNEAGLPTRERLALFRDVCSAINHAHQKGIIHRDIKPSNVMVTMHGEKPAVKVIDFGIAKATQGKLSDKTIFTGFEQFIGTPAYMSPEQASRSGLDIDTRSDIYSLGILLYELLVGKPPFDPKTLISAGYEEMRRIIREVEPPKPSSRLTTLAGEERSLLARAHSVAEGKLNKLVEPDLDWIVMKAIEKDRSQRYETANAFSQDLIRFLTDEPVSATPPSAGYRLRKFARRNRRALTSGAAVGTALLLGLSVAGWVWMDSAWQKASQLAAVEQRASTMITDGEQEIKLNGQVPFEDDASFLRAAEIVRRLDSQVSLEQVSAQLQARKAGLVAAVAREAHDRALVARIEEALMNDMKGLSSPKTTKAQDIAGAFQQSDLNPEALSVDAIVTGITERREALRERIVAGLVDWADSLELAESDKSARLNAIIDRCESDPWRQSLRKAVAAEDGAALDALADSPELSRQPTMTVLRLSSALRSKQLGGGLQKLLRRAQREAPGSFWTNFSLGWALAGAINRPEGHDLSDAFFVNRMELGQSAPGTGTKPPAATPEITEAIGFLRAAAAARPDAALAWLTLGLTLSSGEQWDEAIASYQRALERVPGDANAHLALGMALLGQKRPKEAISVLRKAMELGEQGAFVQLQLGTALAQSGQDDEAISSLQKAFEHESGTEERSMKLEGVTLRRGDSAQALGVARYLVGVMQIGRNDWKAAVNSLRLALDAIPECPRANLTLGGALIQTGDPSNALTCLRRAIELAPEMPEAHKLFGVALLQTGDFEAATSTLRKAITLNPGDAESCTNLGAAFMQVGKTEEAFPWLNKAVELNPASPLAWSNLGAALDRQGNLEEAAVAFRKAIAAYPNYATAQRNLASTLARLGKRDETTALSKPLLNTDAADATAQFELGRALGNQSKFDEAATAFRRAIELDPEMVPAHRGLALALLNSGKLDDAVNAAELVIKLDPKTTDAHAILGTALARMGKFDEAIAACRIAIDLGPVPPITHRVLARSLFKLGRLDEAADSCRQALKLDPKFSVVETFLAFLDQDAANQKQKPEDLESLLKISRAVNGPEHPDTLGTMTNLAMAYLDAGRLAEAIPLQEESLALKRRVLPKNHPFLGIAMGNLAALYQDSGRDAEALKLYQELLALRRMVLGAAHADTLRSMHNLGALHFRAGRLEELARVIAEQIEYLRRAGIGPDTEPSLTLQNQLAARAAELSIAPTQEDAVTSYYAEHQESFRNLTAHVYLIALPLPGTDEAKLALRKKAEDLRRKIAEGTPFAEVARQFSDDQSAKAGGDCGLVARGQYRADLDKLIFSMENGTLAIHEDKEYLRIFKVVDRVEGDIEPLESAREKIDKLLKEQQRTKLLSQWKEAARQTVDEHEKTRQQNP